MVLLPMPASKDAKMLSLQIPYVKTSTRQQGSAIVRARMFKQDAVGLATKAHTREGMVQLTNQRRHTSSHRWRGMAQSSNHEKRAAAQPHSQTDCR